MTEAIEQPKRISSDSGDFVRSQHSSTGIWLYLGQLKYTFCWYHELREHFTYPPLTLSISIETT